jgi:hypothetical protein
LFDTEANYLAALASAAGAALASAAGLAAGAALASAAGLAASAAKAFNESANKPATNEANNLDM